MPWLFKRMGYGWCRQNSGGSSVAVNPMSLLTNMDTAYLGMPYVEGHAKNTATVNMDLAFRGVPYVRYRRAS